MAGEEDCGDWFIMGGSGHLVPVKMMYFSANFVESGNLELISIWSDRCRVLRSETKYVVSLGVCAGGGEQFKEKCYRLHLLPKSWREAKQVCSKRSQEIHFKC